MKRSINDDDITFLHYGSCTRAHTVGNVTSLEYRMIKW